MNRDTGIYTAGLLGLAAVAVLILAALWSTTNGFEQWGKASTVDISVASTPVLPNADEINFTEDICVTPVAGVLADTQLCADIDVSNDIAAGNDITVGADFLFTGYKACDSTAPGLSASISTILNLCSTDRIIAMIDSNGGNSDSCFQVRNENSSNITGGICEISGIFTQDNLYFTGTNGCVTSNESIGVSATANLEVCSRDNVVIAADVNDNGGFSCISFRKNGTSSDMAKICEDSGFSSTDEIRLAPGTNTCLDSGDASPGALTMEPTNSTKLVTNNDPDGCDITLAETDATSGQLIYVVVVSDSSGAVAFPDTSGVQETNGALGSLGVWDSVQFIYASDRWVQVSVSDN